MKEEQALWHNAMGCHLRWPHYLSEGHSEFLHLCFQLSFLLMLSEKHKMLAKLLGDLLLLPTVETQVEYLASGFSVAQHLLLHLVSELEDGKLFLSLSLHVCKRLWLSSR